MCAPRATYVNPNNLFEPDDDDIPPSQPSKRTPSTYGSHIALEQQKQALLERQREIEQQTLDSSSRIIGLLRESEQIGIATAEELSRQGEQLQNTNKLLDEINTNLNYSQKHLNGIKSVFCGLKKYISGKSDQITPRSRHQLPPSLQSAGPSSRLHDTIDNLSEVKSDDRIRSHPTTPRELDAQAQAAPIPDSQQFDQVLDANLDEILHSVSRLKGLGIALGEQIEQQNEIIDTIQAKVDVADIKIGKQNKIMNKIVGK